MVGAANHLPSDYPNSRQLATRLRSENTMIPRTMVIVRQVLTITALVGLVGATNSTNTVGYVPGCSHRGTVDILNSCLAALLASVWSVLHLNVPAKHDGAWVILMRKIKWMVIMILAPEVVCGWAVSDLKSACLSVKQMRDAGHAKWSVVHGFLANQGGFVLEYHCQPQAERKKRLPLFCTQMLELKDYGITVPHIDIEDIDDRNKVNQFAKGFACLQSLWLVTSIIDRAIGKVEVSQLEIMTISYILMALIIYGMWWYKPCNVTTPFVIHSFDDGVPHDIWRRLNSEVEVTSWEEEVRLERRENWMMRNAEFHLWNWGGKSIDVAYGVIGMWGFGILFILVHLIAWNFEFPTSIELWLWRGCSLGALVSLSLITLFAAKIPISKSSSHPWYALGIVIGTFVYIVARSYLVVEAFFSLRKSPPSLYESRSWLNYFPHI